jgi:hypothetical protein
MAEKKSKTAKSATATKTKTEAKPKTRRSSKKMVAGDSQYPIYDHSASRDSYKVGDVVKFEKVRNWLDKGELVEAYGKVVGIGIFDKTVPYLEVSFHDVKKLNSFDLGSDIRRYILEQK